jgi:hypothetical protein
MCGFCNVCVYVCVCVGWFVMCGCVYVGFVMCGCVYVGFVMCGFYNVWVCVCVGGFVMCGCVYMCVL